MNEKQKKFVRTFFFIIVLLIILFNVNKCISRSVIRVTNLPDKEIFFNSTREKLKVTDPGISSTKLKKKLEPGIYILYYDENPGERWYSTMRVKVNDLEKEIKLNFRPHKLPYSKKGLILPDKPNADDIELGSRTWQYSLYNSEDNEIYYDVEINYSLRGNRVGETHSYSAKWWLSVNGSSKSKEQIELTDNENQTFIIFEDKLHQIQVHLTTKDNSAQFELRSILSEYCSKK